MEIVVTLIIAFIVAALVDLICYAKLAEEHQQGQGEAWDEWHRSEEGKAARRPFGAVIVCLKRLGNK